MANETTSKKAPTLNDEFKGDLQATMVSILGSKISKETAWQLYKAAMNAPLDFMLNNKDRMQVHAPEKDELGHAVKDEAGNTVLSDEIAGWAFPQAGVGTFRISKAQPRLELNEDGSYKKGEKRVKQMDHAGLNFLPRFRFVPSSRMQTKIEDAFGLTLPEDLEARAAKAASKPVKPAKPAKEGKATPAPAVDPDEFEIDEAELETEENDIIESSFDIDIDEL